MAATLYVVPASHPCIAVERALRAKGIEFRTVYLVPVFHKAFQKAKFRTGNTVPGVVFDDGTKVIGSRAILRELERRVPEPAFLNGDRGVEEAEAWGDEVLQPLTRRVLWAALERLPAAQLSYTAGVRLTPPVPAAMAKLSGKPVAWAERRINASTDEAVRRDLLDLPGHLDRVEAWLDEGVLGGEQPNAGDLQVATSLRLLTTLEDLAGVFDRPAGAYARRLFPEYPGRCPAGALPAAWLPPARADA